jgi:hypothetical protein
MTTFKTTLTAALFLAAALAPFAAPKGARAETLDIPTATMTNDTHRPPTVSGELVAMIWYRLSGVKPDFDAWALQSDEVKKASETEKMAAQARVSAALQQSFSLMFPGDQIIAELPVTLSDYSLKNKGYLIESFTPATFVKFSHGGKNFGVVPRAIMDQQWIPVEDLAAKRIDDLRRAGKPGTDVTLTLFLSPKTASPKPVMIDGAEWRVLSADIVGAAIFDENGQMVWKRKQALTGEQGTTPEQTQRANELLNLYR